MTLGLTSQQRKALDYITARYGEGVSPSYEEIGRHLGITAKSGIHRIVHGLKERGRIEFSPARARSIRPLGSFGDLTTLSDDDLEAGYRQFRSEMRRRGL